MSNPQEKEIIVLSATQIDDIQACKRKYKYHVEDTYVLPETPEYLAKGEFVHFLLEKYYLGVMEKRELVPLLKEIVDEAERKSIDLPISEDNIKDCLRVFKAYVTKHHGELWEPVYVERPFTKKLYEDDKRLIVIQGRLDLVVDVINDRVIVDHKTGSRDNEPSSMSNQNLAYCWATGERKVVLNKLFFQKEPKFKRYTFGYDDERVKEWEETVIADVLQYYIFNKSRDFYPPNYTSCDKYSGCMYQQVCSSIPEVRDYKLKILYSKGDPHDPWLRK